MRASDIVNSVFDQLKDLIDCKYIKEGSEEERLFLKLRSEKALHDYLRIHGISRYPEINVIWDRRNPDIIETRLDDTTLMLMKEKGLKY